MLADVPPSWAIRLWVFRRVRRSLSEQARGDRRGHDPVPFGARVQVVAAVDRGGEPRGPFRIAGRRVEVDDPVEASRLADPRVDRNRVANHTWLALPSRRLPLFLGNPSLSRTTAALRQGSDGPLKRGPSSPAGDRSRWEGRWRISVRLVDVGLASCHRLGCTGDELFAG